MFNYISADKRQKWGWMRTYLMVLDHSMKIVAFNKELILNMSIQDKLSYRWETHRARKYKKPVGKCFRFYYSAKVFQET